MKLKSSENELIGKWIALNGQVNSDATCERIKWLTSSHLQKIAVSKQWGEWEILYQDPDDRRYWELTYPQSELQGGGPPRLTILSPEQARLKYQIE